MVQAEVAVAWGDVATWFSGIVSAAVVVLSALAFRMSVDATKSAAESARQSGELVQMERERFDEERRDRRREQAVRVNARLVWREHRPGEGRTIEHQWLILSNASYERVTDVVIVVDGPDPVSLPRPLGWATSDVDVISVPMRVELTDLEPDVLAGPTEIRVEVVPAAGLEPTDPPAGQIRLKWLPRPAPFAMPAPDGLDDPRQRNEQLDLFRRYGSRPRTLGDPEPAEGPDRDRARYEHVIGELNRGAGRSGSRSTGGGTHWSITFTDTNGVRWHRTPRGLMEDRP